jgi:hypothetical protein
VEDFLVTLGGLGILTFTGWGFLEGSALAFGVGALLETTKQCKTTTLKPCHTLNTNTESSQFNKYL